ASAVDGPRIARIDPRNGEIERAAPRGDAGFPARDRWPRGRGSGAAGDPVGPARHAGEQERGGAAAPGGLQDPAREDQAVRHLRRTVPAVLTVATRPLVLWWRHHGVRAIGLATAPDSWRRFSSLVRAGRRPPDRMLTAISL